MAHQTFRTPSLDKPFLTFLRPRLNAAVAPETLWRHYRVGDARDLPVEDESLDFIFSSHVFEHLANPLLHLELWRAKLRDGGRVVAVVPDYIGSKDYLAEPSALPDLIAEYRAGNLDPTRDHYSRFAKI